MRGHIDTPPNITAGTVAFNSERNLVYAPLLDESK
jgi:hypothetical protein